jgi:hypothetical protein
MVLAGVVVATVSLAGIAAPTDYVPNHEGDPSYGHHRDSSGADHYGKLYSKPVGGSSGASRTQPKREGGELSPVGLTRTFLPY